MSLASQVAAGFARVGAELKAVRTQMPVVVTQAQYDALATKDPAVLYVIVG